ncbi:Cdc37 N terminal kinase binding-domain-containing protein [Suillus paluster]|uniref:Cdc37 N terminal kinase binding-domain-containing protein n=1 Tax=Suillus paluster TaxID=48578 RepID=UPI001B881B94|nr:Cdc37 N terminal kinase binding-domain-containing protein [Suillus paluster]KAG1745957.1 Cdc37 N terminal kinase binding-domain-containing protein [Suillus paluster]
MPLNYSKWDQLELSDDSDIEGHPNVDKRSLIRWKQRDIHEKRETRKVKISALHAEIACNGILAPRLRDARSRLASADGGLKYFQQLVERLQTSPSPEAPPTNAKDQPTYDAMMLSLLLQIWDGAKSLPADEREAAVLSGLDKHIKALTEHTTKLEKDLAEEENEQKKHITSEDIHEGFESKYIPAKPAPPPVKNAKIDVPKKTTTTEFEVLNPAASSSKAPSPSAAAPKPSPSDEEDDIEEELPELTPSLETFSHLPLWGYEQSFGFIQANRDVVVAGASDALLVAAFRAESKGRFAYAKQCVHQSLLLQYCEKLGRDGVRLFFQKMITGDQRAVPVFVNDVESTYSHLKTRAKAAAAETSEEVQKEQIQLVPENPSASISFNVPDGPPPEDLRLEGPGTEDLEVEQVRKALQMRWDVFEGFPEDLKAALKVGTLEEVNKVLGSMDVSVAEDVVEKLDMAGIMSFVAGGVRDETGNADDDDEENAE